MPTNSALRIKTTEALAKATKEAQITLQILDHLDNQNVMAESITYSNGTPCIQLLDTYSIRKLLKVLPPMPMYATPPLSASSTLFHYYPSQLSDSMDIVRVLPLDQSRGWYATSLGWWSTLPGNLVVNATIRLNDATIQEVKNITVEQGKLPSNCTPSFNDIIINPFKPVKASPLPLYNIRAEIDKLDGVDLASLWPWRTLGEDIQPLLDKFKNSSLVPMGSVSAAVPEAAKVIAENYVKLAKSSDSQFLRCAEALEDLIKKEGKPFKIEMATDKVRIAHLIQYVKETTAIDLESLKLSVIEQDTNTLIKLTMGYANSTWLAPFVYSFTIDKDSPPLFIQKIPVTYLDWTLEN